MLALPQEQATFLYSQITIILRFRTHVLIHKEQQVFTSTMRVMGAFPFGGRGRGERAMMT